MMKDKRESVRKKKSFQKAGREFHSGPVSHDFKWFRDFKWFKDFN